MIKAVLFDYDGTLVDSMEQHFNSWSTVFAKYEREFSGDDFYPFEGEKLTQLVARVYPDCPNPNDLILEKDTIYVKSSIFKFYDGVEEFLQKLKANNIKIAVVTAGRFERIKRTAPEWLISTADAFVTHGDTENGKPAPDPFLKGAKKLNVDISECIAVENAPLGVTSAKSAGAKCVGITSTVDAEILKEADNIIESFKALNDLEEFKYL